MYSFRKVFTHVFVCVWYGQEIKRFNIVNLIPFYVVINHLCYYHQINNSNKNNMLKINYVFVFIFMFLFYLLYY